MLKHYFTRIHVILSRIITVVKDIHQTNRTLADYFLSDYWSSDYMDKLFAGVHKAVQDIDQDYGLFGRFQDYVEAEEAKMKAKLEAVKYCIDAENTLNLVTSSGRLEKVCRCARALQHMLMTALACVAPHLFAAATNIACNSTRARCASASRRIQEHNDISGQHLVCDQAPSQ